MNQMLSKLLELATEGHLEVEGVVIGTGGYEIEIGNDAEHFEGEIKLRVKVDTDVITLGNILAESIR